LEPAGLAKKLHIGGWRLWHHQIRETDLEDDVIDCVLDDLPNGPHAAVDSMGAYRVVSRVLSAELIVKKPSAKRVKDVSQQDGFGRTGQCISASLSSCAGNESALAKNHGQLGDMRLRQPLKLANFRDRHAVRTRQPRNLQQAPESIFFLGGEFHSVDPQHEPNFLAHAVDGEGWVPGQFD